MHITIDGRSVEASFDPRTPLLDLLRGHLELPGTKEGCNQGACGACTILVDGERIDSCLALAIQYEGRCAVTIEGLARRWPTPSTTLAASACANCRSRSTS